MKIKGTISQAFHDEKDGRTSKTVKEIDLDVDISDLKELLGDLLTPAVQSTPKRRSKKVQEPEEQTEPVDPATAAQDDADEKSEEDADKEKRQVGVTLNDVQDTAIRFTWRFGHKAAVTGIQRVIGAKISELKTEDEFKAAIEALEAAINEPATKDELRQAIRDYAVCYDGQGDDLPKAKFTCEDIPQVLNDAVGTGSMNQVKDSDYAKAVVAVRSATEQNRFGRKVVSKINNDA